LTARAREYLLSVGSNVEPERWIDRALELLRLRFALRGVSTRYDVPAVGGRGPQPPFVNLAVRIATDLPPGALREACRRIEEACGRRRVADRYAPRTLDLDVVYGGPGVPADPGLPDPELLEQAYVLVPCAELWPDALHGVAGRTLAALASDRHPGWAAAHRRVEAT
jgi:2-amino-4-hydroxy-6-hydroxymethyldihydropteridine diphosphokinase